MLNIVLFEPEIPQNVGNIARSCVGFNCKLHLIRPYGFIIDDKKLKRAGLDYWDLLKLYEYDSFYDFLKKNKIDENIFIITRHGKITPNMWNPDVKKETYVIFGRESSGLPNEIMEKYLDKSIRIPTINVRSLNLSNCVAIIGHEYTSKNNYQGLDKKEKIKIIY